MVAGSSITLDLNGHTVRGVGAGAGIRVTGNGVTVKNGSIQSFSVGAMSEDRVDSTRFTKLHVFGNQQFGIMLLGFGEEVESSVVGFNGAMGIYSANSKRPHIVDNVVFGNGGFGIYGGPHSDGALYSGNLVSGNAGDGIHTADSTATITGNTTSWNGGSGIVIAEGAPGFAQFYLVAGNVANDNAGHGIDACQFTELDPCAGGFVDGGDNVARRNRTEPQCVNIVCSSRRGQVRISSVPLGEHRD